MNTSLYPQTLAGSIRFQQQVARPAQQQLASTLTASSDEVSLPSLQRPSAPSIYFGSKEKPGWFRRMFKVGKEKGDEQIEKLEDKTKIQRTINSLDDLKRALEEQERHVEKVTQMAASRRGQHQAKVDRLKTLFRTEYKDLEPAFAIRLKLKSEDEATWKAVLKTQKMAQTEEARTELLETLEETLGSATADLDKLQAAIDEDVERLGALEADERAAKQVLVELRKQNALQKEEATKKQEDLRLHREREKNAEDLKAATSAVTTAESAIAAARSQGALSDADGILATSPAIMSAEERKKLADQDKLSQIVEKERKATSLDKYTDQYAEKNGVKKEAEQQTVVVEEKETQQQQGKTQGAGQ